MQTVILLKELCIEREYTLV